MNLQVVLLQVQRTIWLSIVCPVLRCYTIAQYVYAKQQFSQTLVLFDKREAPAIHFVTVVSAQSLSEYSWYVTGK